MKEIERNVRVTVPTESNRCRALELVWKAGVPLRTDDTVLSQRLALIVKQVAE